MDVFTLLVLAADNLQELFADSGTFIDIPESGEMAVTADFKLDYGSSYKCNEKLYGA